MTITPTTERARELVSRLIKLAASIARRAYLPDLAECRTIQHARVRVEALDDQHASLANEIRLAADSLTAALIAAETRGAEERWQPFDTALKDGTVIVVYRQDAGVFTARYISEYDATGRGSSEPCWFTEDGEDLTGYLPTLWQLLPAPPALPSIPPS